MRQYLGKLADGQAVDDVFLAADAQLRSNRNGQPYIQFDLRDRSAGMTGRMWNAGEDTFRMFEAGDYLRVRGKVQTFQNALQMIVTAFDRVDPSTVDRNDFLPQADADVGVLLERLQKMLRSLGDPHLKALAEAFMSDAEFVDAFSCCPAAVKHHHAYLGGLLEHVVTLMDGADRLAPLYPAVNRDLWLMGSFLHDIGKLRELGFKQSFSYTDEGQLLGHLIQGLKILEEKVASVEHMLGEQFPRELLMRLQHVILSHHGILEHGSPKVPMTPEAAAVHLLDKLDATLHQVAREIREDRSGTAWTAYNPTLERRFYKGGSDGVVGDES